MLEIKNIKLNSLDFVYTEHNHALVNDGCFFREVANKVVYILPEFLYLKTFDVFCEYTFEESCDIRAKKGDEMYTNFHRLYVSLFNMCNLPDSQYNTISFNRNDVATLSANCKLFSYGCKIREFPDIPLDLKYPIFIKTEMTSGKNDLPISKINNSKELLERMHSVLSWSLEYQSFLQSNENTFKFYTTPWVDVVEEYRCFVYKRAIVTICPQKFWKCTKFTVTKEDLNDLQTNFVDNYIHDNYCIDVYRPHPGALFKVIETNEWYNSGPGLFTYKEIKEIPKNVVVFKQLILSTM